MSNPRGLTVCHALGEITVNDAEVLKMVEGGTVGVGQLFRHLNVLPTFTLLQAGKLALNEDVKDILSASKGFERLGHTIRDMSLITRNQNRYNSSTKGQEYALWREYELKSPQLSCSFQETFLPGFLDLDTSTWWC